MIYSKEDLSYYLDQDRQALGYSRKRPGLWGYEIWKFQIALRKEEFYSHNQRSFVNRFLLKFWRRIHQHYGIMLGFDIPIGVFGPGLRINHYGYIVVNGNARVGAFCDIHQGVNIGQNGMSVNDSPKIGNNVWIGPGAKLFGNIILADNIAVGANAVVNKSFLRKNITIGGVPAVMISEKGNVYIKER